METADVDVFALSALDRLSAAGSSESLLAAVVKLAEATFPMSRAAATDGAAPVRGDLGRLAARAWEAAQTLQEGSSVAVVAGDAVARVALAISPAVTDPRIVTLVRVASRVRTMLAGAERRAHPSAQRDRPVADQLRTLDEQSRGAGEHLVIGLIDTRVDATDGVDAACAQARRLRHRLRRMLRPQDRVWDFDGRILVAQVLPEPHSALLVDRIWRATRAVHAEAGVAARVVDSWVTARRGTDEASALLGRAAQGLERMAQLRQVALRTLDGDPDGFSAFSEPGTAVVVVDAHRMVRGVNEQAWAIFPEADPAVTPADSVDTDNLTFHDPDGTVLTEDELPGVLAMKTGVSAQDRLIGVRYRNHPMRWALITAVTATDGDGRMIGYAAALTPAELEGPAMNQRVRDAIDMVPEPLVFLLPRREGSRIADFAVQYANSAALGALNVPEHRVVGALESALNPSHDRLGAILDYAQVVTSGNAARQIVHLPDGYLRTTFEVSAEPCGPGVLVVARSLAGTRRGDLSKLSDSLTGLASRQGLLVHLEDVHRRGRDPLTLIMCDIDDFTGVNDSLGRLRSDRYLIEVGRAIAQVAGPRDVVARVGSDEFAVLSTTPDTPVRAQEMAEALRRRLQAGVTVGERQLTAASSLGVAWEAAGGLPQELLGAADSALSRSKAAGGDCVTLGRDRTAAADTLEIESQLRQALVDGDFVVHYQPLIDLPTLRVRGVEALVRWRHRTRGLVYPGEFIEVAERRHLIMDIGEQVVRSVTEQVARWHAELGQQVCVSVNVSTAQLVRPGLAAVIAEQADHWGVDPRCLQLEITESQLLNAEDATLANLWACRDVGCELAIDDFGTGHAGFDYLRRIPARVLKIDKTFVDGLGRDSTDAAIIAGVIAVGHGLGMTVVAEGVEHPHQAAVLQELGCEAAQGWLWSQALPADAVLPLLRAGRVSG